jgi:hypothetical protein
MVKKRKNTDPLAPSHKARWLKIIDQYGVVYSSRRVEPLANLPELIASTAACWASKGWTIESNGDWGVFFMNRRGMRLEVSLSQGEPAADQAHGCVPPDEQT